MPKKGVLIVNLGTPDSPSVANVRKYLREFLMDPRVMDIPFLKRFFLVHFIIAPFRSHESAKLYQKLWTDEGSPLKSYGNHVCNLLQKALGDQYVVSFGMRYQNPSIRDALSVLNKYPIKEITVIPLYPQYASSSTGSTIEKVIDEIKKWEVVPKITFVKRFFDHPLFIEAFVQQGRRYMQKMDYDHFLFSYHGLPERHIQKSSSENYCQLNSKCCAVYHAKNYFCYRAQCFETTRQLAKALNISDSQYSVCFQSRLGKSPWIQPYTDEKIIELAGKGVKRILAFSPSFIADCLETTIEVGEEYKGLFLKHGGAQWDFVESLNTMPLWIDCLKQIALTEQHTNLAQEPTYI